LCIFAVIPGCREISSKKTLFPKKIFLGRRLATWTSRAPLNARRIVSDVIQIEARAEIKSRVLNRLDSHVLIRATPTGSARPAGRRTEQGIQSVGVQICSGERW
jgi:hypothetical protein